MALIECKNCHNSISDKAIQCPHCGYKDKNPMNINYSLIGKLIPTVIGLILALWATFIIILSNPGIINYIPFPYIIELIFGIALFLVGCFLISKQYGKKINKISYIVSGVILLINLIIAPINYQAAKEYAAEVQLCEAELAQSEQTAAEQAEAERASNPDTSDYYFGTWEYTQPNNQDGVKSVRLVVNPDKTVQALVDVKGNQIVVYGSWYWFENRISMHFNDTEEHINGLLYIDHLRVFKGYNDYFGIKYGDIKNENGKTYLYEDLAQARAKNPNKRVELTKID